jgi:hypothetical protein
MKNINWDHVNFFSKDEFNEDPDKYAEPQLIYALSHFRINLNECVFVSPVKGAFARFDGSKTSQHFVDSKEHPSKKSTGIDVFPEGIPIAIFSCLLNQRLIKGIGIYLDTTGNDGHPWVMFHIDIRKTGFKNLPLIWFCTKDNGINKYYYPQTNPEYWSFLKDERMYIRKEFGVSSIK